MLEPVSVEDTTKTSNIKIYFKELDLIDYANIFNTTINKNPSNTKSYLEKKTVIDNFYKFSFNTNVTRFREAIKMKMQMK